MLTMPDCEQYSRVYYQLSVGDTMSDGWAEPTIPVPRLRCVCEVCFWWIHVSLLVFCYAQLHECVPVCMCTFVLVYMHASLQECMHFGVHAYLCTCIFEYMCTFMCMHACLPV